MAPVELDINAARGFRELRDGYLFVLVSAALSAVLGFVPVAGHTIISLLVILGMLKIIEGFRELGDSTVLSHTSGYKTTYRILKYGLIGIVIGIILLFLGACAMLIYGSGVGITFGTVFTGIDVLIGFIMILFVLSSISYLVSLFDLGADTDQLFFTLGGVLTVMVIIIQIFFVHSLLALLSSAAFSLSGIFHIFVSLILLYLVMVVMEVITLFLCYKACTYAIDNGGMPEPKKGSNRLIK